MSNFQIILIGIFIVFIIGGALAFASFSGVTGGKNNLAIVSVWGTLPQADMDSVIKQYGVNAKYTEEDPASFENNFTEALADGTGPDIVILTQDQIAKESQKIFTIPYANYGQDKFKADFLDEADLFLGANGVIAVPISIDPMVLYWNRDLFSSAGIAAPPSQWDQLYSMAPLLTKKDQSSVISQSAIDLGEYSNVTHAKDILSTLILQAGNPIVSVDAKGDYQSDLSDTQGSTVPATNAALSFYTGFSDPTKAYYSWNSSFPDAEQDFINGNLAMYIGFASEYGDIQNKNPNLNFDVAPLPQIEGSKASITFGELYGMVILNNSVNKASDIAAVGSFSSSEVQKSLSALLNLPPVRNDLLATAPGTGEASNFYTAAIQSRAWVDPDSQSTEPIFQNMIESVTSGAEDVDGAVGTASDQLEAILRQNEGTK